MRSKPTIQMVAELAKVSRATVDRVLNDRPHVNEEARQRVLEAIRELGYVSPREIYRRQADASVQPLTLGVLLPNWGGQFQTEVTSKGAYSPASGFQNTSDISDGHSGR